MTVVRAANGLRQWANRQSSRHERERARAKQGRPNAKEPARTNRDDHWRREKANDDCALVVVVACWAKQGESLARLNTLASLDRLVSTGASWLSWLLAGRLFQSSGVMQ